VEERNLSTGGNLDVSLATVYALQKSCFDKNLGSYEPKYLRIKCIDYIGRKTFFN
jgi:hypothetical protein